jgi:hypothetical protein
MEPSEIMKTLEELNRQLWPKNSEYKRLISDRAQAEHDYNVMVAKITLELRANDQPITLIDKLVKGDSEVADLKLKFEIALGLEKACASSIKDIRSNIDTFRSFLSWKKTEAERGL